MKHSILLSLALLLLPAASRAQDAPTAQETAAATSRPSRTELSFGYFSYQDVFTNMPGYDEAQRRIAALRDTYQQELTRSKEEFTRQFGEFIDGQQTFPENILLKRQKELEQLMDGNLKFRDEARELLRQEEENTLAPLRRQLDDAVTRLGLERGFAFILDTDKGAFPFVSGAVGTDVTADLLTLLK